MPLRPSSSPRSWGTGLFEGITDRNAPGVCPGGKRLAKIAALRDLDSFLSTCLKGHRRRCAAANEWQCSEEHCGDSHRGHDDAAAPHAVGLMPKGHIIPGYCIRREVFSHKDENTMRKRAGPKRKHITKDT